MDTENRDIAEALRELSDPLLGSPTKNHKKLKYGIPKYINGARNPQWDRCESRANAHNRPSIAIYRERRLNKRLERERTRPQRDAVRFWKYIAKSENCWEWQGAIDRASGYGHFSYNKRTRISPHRYSWMLHFGDIPKGLNVLHTCDNRICARPDHLFLGTYADNMRDASQKGRLPRGILNNKHKVTEDQVRELRSLYIPGAKNQSTLLGPSQGELAIKFGLSQSTVSAILLRKTWRHL